MTAAIFWLKTRGGWRETPQDHTVGVYDMATLSDAELGRIAGTVSVRPANQDA